MDAYLGEIRILPFNYAPLNWALCNGQIMAISQNTALFSIIGTYYGGNGTSVFALPNLQARIPMGSGNGPGLSPRAVGDEGGDEVVTLNASQLPGHGHTLRGVVTPGDSASPAGGVLARAVGATPYAPAGSATTPMAQNAISAAPGGGGQPHNNMQPYLTVNFNICLNGIFPSRS